jgi:hypothetical protein
MIRAGDRKFYAMLQRRSNAHHSPEDARSYRESDPTLTPTSTFEPVPTNRPY